MVRHDFVRGEERGIQREHTKYYKGRFFNLFDIIDEYDGELINPFGENPEREIMFRNGYNKDSPSFIAKCTLSIGTGKEEWGAEKDKQYFVLTIHEIMRGSD